jgi:hypothetical protein
MMAASIAKETAAAGVKKRRKLLFVRESFAGMAAGRIFASLFSTVRQNRPRCSGIVSGHSAIITGFCKPVNGDPRKSRTKIF